MTNSIGSYLINRTVSAVLFSIVALAAAVPSDAQRTTFTAPRYTPPAQTYHPPAQTPRPAPQSTYHPPAQTQPRPAQSEPRPAQTQPTPPRTIGSTPQPRHETTQPRPVVPSRKEVQKQEKAQARTQQEQKKQNQKQQKEQARAQKEQQKQNQKQLKEQAHQQKELQKKQRSENKVAKSAKSPKTPKARATSPVAKAPASKIPSGVPASESQARIQRLNASRLNMSGINRRPLPAGEVTVHANGRMTLKTEGGRQYGLRSNGTIASYSDREKTVSFDKRGKVSSIHTASMDIHNGAHGQRTIISRRADGSKVVSSGRHSGYVERRVVMNNRTYVQRTTVLNQRVYTGTFVVNGFGGVGFVPPVFFAPGFYGWAYHPWAVPISFTWGWVGAPWYVGPNPYFVASPLYPSAAYLLTDYVIGETLATAYQMHNDEAESDDMSADDGTALDSAQDDMSAEGSPEQQTLRADATTPITPEIKAEIAEQVKQEVANDNAEAGNPSQASFDVLPLALSTANHVFVVSSDLDVSTTDQQLCALQAGDMLQLIIPAASDASLVELRVASSKRTDCPAGVRVSVSVPDLQEMQNSFQARIEAGLGKLRSNQGRAGLPSAPADAVAAAPRPSVTGLTPDSATDSATALDQQRDEADQVEKQAASDSF